MANCILYNNTPGVADPSLLPFDGDHTLMGADSSIHLIEFQSHSGGYQITQTTIESDGTTMLLSERVTPTEKNGAFTIHPCSYNMNVRMHHRFKGAYLAVNGKKAIQLNAKSVTIQTEDRLTYFDSTVTITGKNEYSFSNITTLWYHDTFCFYSFKNRKSEPLFGPGTLLIGNRLGLYSTSSEVSEKIQSLIQSESNISGEGGSVAEEKNEQHWKRGSLKKGSVYANKKRVRRQTAAWTVSEWSEVRRAFSKCMFVVLYAVLNNTTAFYISIPPLPLPFLSLFLSPAVLCNLWGWVKGSLSSLFG